MKVFLNKGSRSNKRAYVKDKMKLVIFHLVSYRLSE